MDLKHTLIVLFWPICFTWKYGTQIQAVLCLHGSLTTWFSKQHGYFGNLICPFSTKSLLRLHSFLLTNCFSKVSKNSVRRGPLVYTYLTCKKGLNLYTQLSSSDFWNEEEVLNSEHLSASISFTTLTVFSQTSLKIFQSIW